MLMTAAAADAAALHMDSAALGLGPSPSSSSNSPTPPWLPASLADDNHRHHQLIPCDFAVSAPSPAPATAPPPSHHHHHLRPAAAARRVAKRRPRPSRKLPTTYITADPASFRRMVHQVTGADDLPAPPAETLCRPAPYRAAPSGGAMLLPTLDTSAFLLGAPGAAATRTDAPCTGSARSAAAPALVQVQAEVGGLGVESAGGGACNYNGSSGSSCGGGFPTLDSWDPLF